MARPIDAYTLNNDFVSWYNDTEDEKEKSILRRVMQRVVQAPTITPPNEALTLEQLREMDGEPAYVVSAIGERSEWYIVDLEENELKNPWDRIALDNWDERYPYTAYRRPPDGKETIK